MAGRSMSSLTKCICTLLHTESLSKFLLVGFDNAHETPYETMDLVLISLVWLGQTVPDFIVLPV